jgi:hypothetical protein
MSWVIPLRGLLPLEPIQTAASYGRATLRAIRQHRDMAQELTDEPHVWVVWRQDDNGNRFVVARLTSRAEAEQLAAEMDGRGHRQVYWVEAD